MNEKKQELLNSIHLSQHQLQCVLLGSNAKALCRDSLNVGIASLQFFNESYFAKKKLFWKATFLRQILIPGNHDDSSVVAFFAVTHLAATKS